MAKQFKLIPMQHPWKIGRDGRPFIQQIKESTVLSGKAQKMGYIPVRLQAPAYTPPPSFAQSTQSDVFETPIEAVTEVIEPKKVSPKPKK